MHGFFSILAVIPSVLIVAGPLCAQTPAAPSPLSRQIDQFIQEAESRVRLLIDAAASDDRAALTAGAHSLKGSSMIMGAQRLAALCVQLEGQLADGPDRPIAPALLIDIDHELAHVRDALAAQRAGR